MVVGGVRIEVGGGRTNRESFQFPGINHEWVFVLTLGCGTCREWRDLVHAFEWGLEASPKERSEKRPNNLQHLARVAALRYREGRV